jgi:excisionase family DNA binding protein
MQYMTTEEKAEQLGITRRRVLVLLKDKRFPGAMKRGRDWLIPGDTMPDERHEGPPMHFRMMDKG